MAFKVIPEGKNPSVGCSKFTGHLLWDVQIDFTRKARWVLDRHKTPYPIGSTYAGVVSRESVRIAFIYASLNGIEVCAAYIRNTYLQAHFYTKEYTVYGPNFGTENMGKYVIV